MTEEERSIVARARRMEVLLENKEFTELIVEGFLTDGLISQTYGGDLDSGKTIDQLKARQIFKNYIDDIISQGQIILEEQHKEN